MSVMINQRERVTVAIQGVTGSFHEAAAIEYFHGNEVAIIPCDTFSDLFRVVEEGRAEYGIVAFENSVAGSILPNYELLRRSHLTVNGELYLRVRQNLVALAGQSVSDIREIHSHPMAIQQCSAFLTMMRERGVRVVESIDTALSAKLIKDGKQYGLAAIASSRASHLLGLEILRAEIEDDSRNYTRFLVVSANRAGATQDDRQNYADKAMICFTLPHTAGSLSQVLTRLASWQINLTKIESVPLVGRPWEYLFHIDLVYSDYDSYRRALDDIRPITEGLVITGEFRQGGMAEDFSGAGSLHPGAGVRMNREY